MIKLFFILFIEMLFGACHAPKGASPFVPDSTDKIVPHSILGERNARNQLKNALKEKGQRLFYDPLIKDSATAISIAEPILFKAFGEKQILSEKPYEIYLLDGYWYVSGTIPVGEKGGGFEIIFSSRTGEIIRLTHYK